jgi:hypothetical protein
MSKKLSRMVLHALNLCEDGNLNKEGLDHLIEVLDEIRPELKIVILASDLSLYRNLTRLNEYLKEPVVNRQSDTNEKFDWESLRI